MSVTFGNIGEGMWCGVLRRSKDVHGRGMPLFRLCFSLGFVLCITDAFYAYACFFFVINFYAEEENVGGSRYPYVLVEKSATFAILLSSLFSILFPLAPQSKCYHLSPCVFFLFFRIVTNKARHLCLIGKVQSEKPCSSCELVLVGSIHRTCLSVRCALFYLYRQSVNLN